MSKHDIEVTDFNLEENMQEENLQEVQEENLQEEAATEQTPKKKKQNIVSVILVCVGVICIGIALYGLYDIYMEYKVAENLYDKVEEEFVHVNIPESEEPDSSTDVSTEQSENTGVEKPKGPWYKMVSVDLKGLQSKYSEVVGWLFFENETISYPIMHTTDNKKYLRMAYDGSYANAGSIFMETTHKSDFSQMHTLVYGHNQKDANMFGKLKLYKKKSGYYNDHQYFQIFSEDKIYRYQIFAYQVVDVDSFAFHGVFEKAPDLANKLLENSMINPGIEIKDGDKIVTLCTCTDDTKNRFIVSAVLVGTYDRTTQTLIEN